MVLLQQVLMDNITKKKVNGENKLPSGYSMYGNINPCLLSEDDNNEILYHISSCEGYIYT